MLMTAGQARQLLGLPTGADGEAVDHAYRAAVKTAHPDREGGDAERLRQVIEAHQVLKSMSGSSLNFTLVRRPPEAPARRARRVTLQISIHEALFGGERPIETEQGRQLNVRLPAGLRPNDTLRLGGADEGADLLLRIAVMAGPGVAIRGDDLWLETEVDADDIHEGRGLDVDTPRGRRGFVAPRSAEDGSMVMVRFKGEGLPARGSRPAGDLIISLVLRESRSRALLRRFTARWAA